MSSPVQRLVIAAALFAAISADTTGVADVARARQGVARGDSLGTLVIVVRDGENRHPVPLVTVLDVDRRTGAITDPGGIAKLHGLGAGKVRLRIYNESYYSRTSAAVVHTGRSDTLWITMQRDHRKRPKERMIMVDIRRPAWVW
jgi:hypothetical protein